tara:strand:- start:274 stop:405 length:132 start_codon:yes stop_codon:yes gene_type:complete
MSIVGSDFEWESESRQEVVTGEEPGIVFLCGLFFSGYRETVMG